MRGKYFEEFSVGDHFTTLRRTITETDIVNFVALAGWYEPLFMDMLHVKNTPLKERFAPGPLTVSIAMGQVAREELLLDTAVGALGFTVKFPKPVRVGDTLVVDVDVISKKETTKADRGVIDFKFSVKNQNGIEVAEIIETVMVIRKPKGGR